VSAVARIRGVSAGVDMAKTGSGNGLGAQS
jgi:hypothetical protein